MVRPLELVKWATTLGSRPQAFLDAKWVKRKLDRAPESKKRLQALRLLALSPHYFLNRDSERYRDLSNDAYLETAFSDLVDSRQKIFDYLLKDRLAVDDVVIDYGSGPGFLAKIVAGSVKQVYGCDISEGTIACAEVLNYAPNLQYVKGDLEGLMSIPDGSVDAVYSFAVIQHLSDEIFDVVLNNCFQKLKPGGRLILQVQLLDDTWRSEEEWRSDTSLKGKLKLRYGLHCFGRTAEAHIERVEQHGFRNVNISQILDLVPDRFDDICDQHLLTANRP